MASSTVQKQKEIYSRDLAAYTLRQWNAVQKVTHPPKPKAKDEITVKSSDTTPDSGHEPLQTKKNRNSYTVDSATAGTKTSPLCLTRLAKPS